MPILNCRESYYSYSQIRRVLYLSLFCVNQWEEENISYFFAIGWNRRELYQWVGNLRLWDSGLDELVLVEWEHFLLSSFPMINGIGHGEFYETRKHTGTYFF
jgi:hypothetical protein